MKKNYTAGFSILFAVLVSSIVLAIGASLANKAAREIVFATSGRESQKAFYSADTGFECAFYLDKKDVGVFATSTATYVQVGPRYCVEQDITNGWTISAGSSGGAVTVFSLDASDNARPEPICATVTVTKKVASGSGPVKYQTTIVSRGYNTCNTSDSRRVERALQGSYLSTQ